MTRYLLSQKDEQTVGGFAIFPDGGVKFLWLLRSKQKLLRCTIWQVFLPELMTPMTFG